MIFPCIQRLRRGNREYVLQGLYQGMGCIEARLRSIGGIGNGFFNLFSVAGGAISDLFWASLAVLVVKIVFLVILFA